MGKLSQILNVSKGDPDTPTLTESITGPYKAGFMQSMNQGINELEQHCTCTIVSRNSVTGAHLITITWYFKVEHFPGGRLRKFKSRFYARGDIQVE